MAPVCYLIVAVVVAVGTVAVCVAAAVYLLLPDYRRRPLADVPDCDGGIGAVASGLPGVWVSTPDGSHDRLSGEDALTASAEADVRRLLGTVHIHPSLRGRFR
jgi:hypothetical protein